MATPPPYSSHEIVFEHMKREFLYVEGTIKNALVVLLHPFNGTPETALARFADLYHKGFSILVPRGIEKSWNGGACCGRAVQLGLNDVGFIRELTRFVMKQKFIHPLKAYIVGVSNGAFLASKVALTSIAHGEDWIKGVALISGYTYDLDVYEAARSNAIAANSNIVFPILALHGKDDQSVKIEGCCHEDCCCGITSNQCFSFQSAFEEWSKITMCASTGVENTQHNHLLASRNVTCTKGKACMAHVEFCQVANAGHRLDDIIPVADIVTSFFYQNLQKSQNLVELTTRKEVISSRGVNPRAPPVTATPPWQGVVIVVLFVVSLLFTLNRVFKTRSRSATNYGEVANPRELQSLTGRTGTNFAAAQV